MRGGVGGGRDWRMEIRSECQSCIVYGRLCQNKEVALQIVQSEYFFNSQLASIDYVLMGVGYDRQRKSIYYDIFHR